MRGMEKAYIAGFFDGEGCIYIYHRHTRNLNYEPVFCITQKNPEILYKIAKLLTQITKHDVKVYPENKLKTSYSLRIYRKQSIEQVLIELYPFLSVKKEQAKVMISYLQGIVSDIEAYTLLRELK